MNRRLLVLATTVALMALSGALAQGDNLLQRYDLAMENLEIATASVPTDGVEARDELERALNALLTLSTSSTSPNLVQAMERTFDRTRTAIENQSKTDMAVQTAVLAGGFARIVMDAAFTAANEGNMELASSRLLHLAEDLEFGEEATESISGASNGEALRLAFEAGAAESVAHHVKSSEELATTDVHAAYVSLGRAYGQSLLVQDSPRVSADLNSQLVAAANALVESNIDAAEGDLGSAEDSLAALALAARGEAPPASDPAGEAEATPTPTDASPPGESAQATEDPATTQAEGLPLAAPPATEAAPAEVQEAAETAPSEEAAATEGAGANATPAEEQSVMDQAAFDAAVQAAVEERVQELEEQAHNERVATLSRSLALAGVPGALSEAQAEHLLGAGYDSLGGAVAATEALAARVVASQRSGDASGARSWVNALATEYSATLAPLMNLAHPEVGADTTALIASLQDRPVLDPQEATLLVAQTAAVRSALLGDPAPAGQNLELLVDSYWANWTGTIVLILLALLAIVPLVLLNLAFGGSNRNWRLVGWALFFLLLPVFYEGVVAAVSLASRFTDLPWLEALSSYSAFASTTGKVVWAFLVLVAVLLATAGFYGICVQFGILGSRKATTPTVPTTQQTAHQPTGTTTIDWDEEF